MHVFIVKNLHENFICSYWKHPVSYCGMLLFFPSSFFFPKYLNLLEMVSVKKSVRCYWISFPNNPTKLLIPGASLPKMKDDLSETLCPDFRVHVSVCDWSLFPFLLEKTIYKPSPEVSSVGSLDCFNLNFSCNTLQSPGKLSDFSKSFPWKCCGWKLDCGDRVIIFCKTKSVSAKRCTLLWEKILNKWVLYVNHLTYACCFIQFFLGKHALVFMPLTILQAKRGTTCYMFSAWSCRTSNQQVYVDQSNAMSGQI